jgi:hypothetical protein
MGLNALTSEVEFKNYEAIKTPISVLNSSINLSLLKH